MKVYTIEKYDQFCETDYVVKVCKRKDVAESFITIFKHRDNSRKIREMQNEYFYATNEYILVE